MRASSHCYLLVIRGPRGQSVIDYYNDIIKHYHCELARTALAVTNSYIILIDNLAKYDIIVP